MALRINIYQDIGKDNPFLMMFGMEPISFSAESMRNIMDSAPDEKQVELRINSDGGSVTEGWAAADILRDSGKEITAVVDGMCASIATVLLLSAPKERRKMLPHASLFIHNPYVPGWFLDAVDHQEAARLHSDMLAERDKLLNYYVERTGADRGELEELMNSETELNADEAKRLGFVGEVITPASARKFNRMTDEQKKLAEELKKITDANSKQGSLISKLLAKLGVKLAQNGTLAMELTDNAGNVLTIEREEGDPQVGDAASPDGTFTMTDGTVYVVEGGKITSITPASDDSEADALKTENAALKTEVENLKAKVASMEKDSTEAKALLTELRALKSSFNIPPRTVADPKPGEVKTDAQAKIDERKAKYQPKKA